MLQTHIKQRLVDLRSQAVEVPGSNGDFRAWVVIYPYKDQSLVRHAIEMGVSVSELREQNVSAQTRFRLRWFEVPKIELEQSEFDLEGDEEFIKNCFEKTALTLEEVETHLASLFQHDLNFDYPSPEYPL